jgi:type IV secretory pathway TrbF-like protein
MKKSFAENPYLKGSQAFMQQYGSILVAANQWRLISIVLAAALVILAAGFVWVSSQHRVVPYAVEFNEHAEVVRVTRADAMPAPNANQVRASIRQWVIGAKTVYGDLRALQAMLDQTYATTLPGSPADKAIRSFHEGNNPYERASKETVEVAVNSVMPLGGDTWRVEWTEKTKAANGQVVDAKVWQGSCTVVIVPPVDDKQILVNPIGVYVKDFTWSVRQL